MSERRNWLGAAGLAIAGSALLMLCLAAPAAQAGSSRYVWEMCDSSLPGGGIEGVVAAPHPLLPFGVEGNCQEPGGSLIVRQGEVSPGGSADWAVPMAPPTGASLETISISAAACGQALASIWSPGWSEPARSWPDSSLPCPEEVRSFKLLPSFKAFFIELKCLGECHAGPWIYAHYFAATVADPVAPTAALTGGSLLEAGPRRGRQNVAVDGSDVGGGVAKLFVMVNGTLAGQPKAIKCAVVATDNPSVSGIVASQPSPCPKQADARWTLDTGAYPFHQGPNSVQACASDFSTLGDANTSCAAAQGVRVDNSCPDSSHSGGEALSARFALTDSGRVSVGYKEAATVVGRVTDGGGGPVGGATLCISSSVIGVGERPGGAGSVQSDPRGRYRYRVPPGPNRRIVIALRRDSEVISRRVTYYARSRPRLRVAPARVRNDERIKIWGAVPGPRSAGDVVILQAGAVGSPRWFTFRKATTGKGGHFRASYRFDRTTGRALYRIRALVPRQSGYPWLAGHSNPVRVEVGG